MRRAAWASVSVSLFLVGIKAFAYFASHSVAMLASLADSALDLFTSSINLFAIRQALTPADAPRGAINAVMQAAAMMRC